VNRLVDDIEMNFRVAGCEILTGFMADSRVQLCAFVNTYMNYYFNIKA
jgi:hypothetical protein